MENTVQRSSVDDFIALLNTEAVYGHHKDGSEFLIGEEVHSAKIPVKVLSNPILAENLDSIAIVFHGSVDQKSREIPVFYGDQIAKRYGDRALILSIADPSLRLDRKLMSCFYAGDMEVRTQYILGKLFGGLKGKYTKARFMFIAGSTGAHPALYHSYQIDDSICLVANPLPRIRGYYQPVVDQYLKICWSESVPESVFSEKICDDIGELYSKGHKNTVIIVQNTFDHHLSRQVLPFATCFPNTNKFLFISEFYADHIGHNYPTARWLDWVRAIMTTTSTSLAEIAKISEPIARTEPPGNKIDVKQISDRDIFIASSLVSQH